MPDRKRSNPRRSEPGKSSGPLPIAASFKPLPSEAAQ